MPKNIQEINSLTWAQQHEEIKHLTQKIPFEVDKYSSFWLPKAALTPEILSQREADLNAININLILSKIDLKSTYLSLKNLNITRFPRMLIEDPLYIDYWKKLYFLDCESNQLVELNLNGLTSLQVLNCNNNKLKSIELSKLFNLTKINFSHNQLCILNLDELTAVTHLNCGNNKLVNLDLHRLEYLQVLDASNNNLTEINLSHVTRLEDLKVHYNDLSTLNLESCSTIKRIDCKKNKITHIIFAPDEKTLQMLDCCNNQLSSLNLEDFNKITFLDISGNPLTSLNLKNASALETLLVRNSTLTELNLQGVPKNIQEQYTHVMASILTQRLEKLNLQVQDEFTSLNKAGVPAVTYAFESKNRVQSSTPEAKPNSKNSYSVN